MFCPNSSPARSVFPAKLSSAENMPVLVFFSRPEANESERDDQSYQVYGVQLYQEID